MDNKHDELGYFTMLLLVLTALSSFFSIVILPEIIVGPLSLGNGPTQLYIASTFDSLNIALPSITKYVIKFGEAYYLRYILFAIIFLVLIALEIKCKNRKIAGTTYIIILVSNTILGYLTLLTVLLPFMPL